MNSKENFLATIKGEKADRYVNQYEALAIIRDPIMVAIGGFAITMQPGDHEVNGWGVTVDYPVGAPGPFPIHNDEVTVLKDVTKWREVVKAPNVVLPDEEWAEIEGYVNSIDRDKQLVTAFIGPGLLEKIHYLLGMEELFIAMYDEPEALLELIDFVADWEIELGKELVKHLKPDAVFHHDDWGSQTASFMSPEMFEKFIMPAYKKIYGYFKEQGCIIVHHSDSYAANLVPGMIELGIDVWQGVMSTNNIPELIEKFGDKITFMGGIDSGKFDRENWTPESVCELVEKICRENGTKHFIPCTTMGGPDSIYPGAYDQVTKAIDKMNKILF